MDFDADNVEKSIFCPYCGERIDVFVDTTVHSQSYIEDCQVCCRPIEIQATAAPDGDVVIDVRTDSE